MSISLSHFSDLTTLETDHLIMKPLNLNFLSQDYVDWMNDEKVNIYLESGGDYTLEKLINYLEDVERFPKYFWAIIHKEKSKHVGNIKIDPIDFKELYGEYGIMIGDRTFWGKGIAMEASEKIIEYCFNILNLQKIRLGVKKNNFRAIRLYEKLGFVIDDFSKSKFNFQKHFRMYLDNPNLK